MLRKLLDSPWFYFGLAGLLAIAAVASQLRYGPPPQPKGDVEDVEALAERDDWNLIFILIDTLRADRLGSYGYERPTSPNLDALAATGIQFDHVEAQSSWTKASMASLWTGLYPRTTGILRYNHVLPEEARLPAEILREAGLYTAGIYRNGWVNANFGFGQGFNMYVKPRPNFDAERFERRAPNAAHPLKGTDLDLTQSALEFLQARGDERFFLYIHYMDVHQYAYDSNSDLFGTSYSDIYDNAIHWTDSNIGALVKGLEQLGLRDETVIVIVSDHGEAFHEHGTEGHAKGLYREVQRVPWIMSLPFDIEGGIRVETHVANIDVWPTVLDMLGLEPLPHAEGRSALPLVLAAARGEEDAARDGFEERPVFAQIDRHWGKPQLDPNPFVAIVKPPWRLHHKQRFENLDELFDHRSDPTEERNVVRDEPEVADRLRGEIGAYLEGPRAYWGENEEVELDQMRLDQLRALGYAIDDER